MNNNYDFGRAFSDFDEDFDPFAIPYERAVNCFDVNDEFLDMNTFVLAAVAGICLENSGEAGNDYCLFSQLSSLLHPDRPAAYYALHYARMFVNRLPGKDDLEPDIRETVYQDIEAALREILAKVCGSEKELEKLFDRRDYDEILYNIDEFLGEECVTDYLNDPFFALAVALYTSLSLNAKRIDAVSLMYEHLPYTDFAPQNCFDAIGDAILLVDKIGVRPLQSKHSFTVLLWYIFKALNEYYEKMLENEWEFENSSDDETDFDDIPELGNDEAADEDDPGFDEVFDFSGDDEEEEDALAFEDVFGLSDEEETA